jgi:hypothetical protein
MFTTYSTFEYDYYEDFFYIEEKEEYFLEEELVKEVPAQTNTIELNVRSALFAGPD